MRATLGWIPALLLSATLLAGQGTPARTLDIYLIDTEGGQATLYVAPTGESVLVDAGNPGTRDADRIMATLNAAGVRQLDYLLLTHYHVDHIGGVTELAKRIPILHYVDHGPTVEATEQVAGFQQAYAELYGKARHTVVKPGDRLPIASIDWRIVSSAGQVLQSPLPGAGQPNPGCASFQRQDITRDLENAQSVGSVVSYGQFRSLNLGDLLWNVEYDLVCPTNKIGTVDLYITSHHGLAQSGSPTLVHAVRPRVAVMNNGTRKGGAAQTFQTLRVSPGLEDIWQLHWAYNAGLEHNSPGMFIANLDDPAAIAAIVGAPPAQPGGVGAAPGAAPGAPTSGAPTPGGNVAPPAQPGAAGAPGVAPPAGQPGAPGAPAGAGGARGTPHTGEAFLIKISARADGSFTVTNTRNNFSKTYQARQ